MVLPRLAHTSIISPRLLGAAGLRLGVTSMLKPYKIESDPAEDALSARPESTDEKQTEVPVLDFSLCQECGVHSNVPDVCIHVKLSLPRPEAVHVAPGGIRWSQEIVPAKGD